MKQRGNNIAQKCETKLPRSRVSRSHNASVKCTDLLYSFMRKHAADQTPETQKDDNEKTEKLIDCAQLNNKNNSRKVNE